MKLLGQVQVVILLHSRVFLGVARPFHRKSHPTQQQSGSVEEAERALQGSVAAYLPLLAALVQDEVGSTALLFRLVVKPRL